MLIGYTHVSTDDQHSALQRDALTEAGSEKIFDEIMSGAHADRPQLQAALDFARKIDVIVVSKLDRLARSLT
jgi:DNA invertase Pin-like site-specific DNA recombinase